VGHPASDRDRDGHQQERHHEHPGELPVSGVRTWQNVFLPRGVPESCVSHAALCGQQL
jgi:hypothetical protein